jgi:hypothetical protein
MRRNRRDAHHLEIVRALRAAGYYVLVLADLKHGVFDLMVVSKSRQQLTTLMEIKTPGEHLTEDEQRFSDAYPGAQTVVFSVEQALAHMRLIDTWVIE